MKQWNLIKLRSEHNETQAFLANLLEISENAYRDKENGKTQFKGDEMFIIADYYEKGIADIFLPSKYTKSKQLN